MLKYVGILVGLIVLLVIFLLLKNAFTGGAKYSYPDIEKKLVTAAKKYTKDFPGTLPTTPNTSFTVSSRVLEEKGYINDLTGYAKDDVICNGSVEVFMTTSGNYNYVPELICGGKYETIRLANKVIEDNDYGTVIGSGLYERVNGVFTTDYNYLGMSGTGSDFEYVFRGDEVNNYVKIDDNLWRIVSINAENNMLLIFNDYIQKGSAWDDRYNEDVNKYQGVNIYEQNGIKSRAMSQAESFYNGTVVLKDRVKYSEKTKYLTTTMDLCIGKRSTTDSDMSGKIECQEVLQDQYVGLLPAYYYMSASLDPSCNSIISKNCGNYNYLSQFNDYWWLLTGNSENTNEAYHVSQKKVDSTLCNFKSYIRPIIMLGSRAAYESGTGTLNDPYIVKFYE